MSTDSHPAHAAVYTRLRYRLETNDVALESLTQQGPDPQLQIDLEATDGPLAVSVLTAAIVIREFPELVTNRFAIRVTHRGSILATASVDARWIVACKEGQLSKLEYARRVLSTWRVFGGHSVLEAQG